MMSRFSLNIVKLSSMAKGITRERIVEWLLRRFEDRLAPLNASTGDIRALDDLWLALHLRFEAIDAYNGTKPDWET